MSERTEQTNRTLADWVSDIVTVESHIEEALDRQLELKPGSQATKDMIQKFHDSVRDSKHRAVEFEKSFGEGSGNRVIEKGGELLGKAAGLVDKVRKDSVTKALRDDYVAFNLAAVSYTLLHITAHALADEKTMAFAEQGLITYADLVQDVNRIIPQATIDDLIANKDVQVVDSNVEEHCRQMIDRAWKRTSN